MNVMCVHILKVGTISCPNTKFNFKGDWITFYQNISLLDGTTTVYDLAISFF